MIIVSFAVVIIGGLGSIEGAAIGALIVGLARVARRAHLAAGGAVQHLPRDGRVLVFRPEGLFQRVKARQI